MVWVSKELTSSHSRTCTGSSLILKGQLVEQQVLVQGLLLGLESAYMDPQVFQELHGIVGSNYGLGDCRWCSISKASIKPCDEWAVVMFSRANSQMFPHCPRYQMTAKLNPKQVRHQSSDRKWLTWLSVEISGLALHWPGQSFHIIDRPPSVGGTQTLALTDLAHCHSGLAVNVWFSFVPCTLYRSHALIQSTLHVPASACSTWRVWEVVLLLLLSWGNLLMQTFGALFRGSTCGTSWHCQ